MMSRSPDLKTPTDEIKSSAKNEPSSASDLTGWIVVPARLASTRLPNKLLLDRTGKALLAHVVDRALEAAAASNGRLTRVAVAIDDARLEAAAGRTGVDVVTTSIDHLCGTTRIAECVDRLLDRSTSLRSEPKPDFIVNIQGDEPELSPRAVLAAVDALVDRPEASMSTLVVPIDSTSELAAMKSNPAAVKAVVAVDGRALYFSRATVPFDRNEPAAGEPLWRLHLGVYVYRTDFLFRFASSSVSPLERRESLEQLRALEAGAIIQTASIPWDWAGKGIDTLEDYEAFVRRFAERR